MMGCVFLLFAIGSALYGFSIGSFPLVMFSAVLFLFGLASFGMDAPVNTGRRPPTKPPGWRNRD